MYRKDVPVIRKEAPVIAGPPQVFENWDRIWINDGRDAVPINDSVVFDHPLDRQVIYLDEGIPINYYYTGKDPLDILLELTIQALRALGSELRSLFRSSSKDVAGGCEDGGPEDDDTYSECEDDADLDSDLDPDLDSDLDSDLDDSEIVVYDDPGFGFEFSYNNRRSQRSKVLDAPIPIDRYYSRKDPLVILIELTIQVLGTLGSELGSLFRPSSNDVAGGRKDDASVSAETSDDDTFSECEDDSDLDSDLDLYDDDSGFDPPTKAVLSPPTFTEM